MPEGFFQIFVKSMLGKTIVLTVNLSMTTEDIKRMVHEKEDIPIEEIGLVFSGKPLLPNHTIKDFGIYKDCTIHLTLRQLGGI